MLVCTNGQQCSLSVQLPPPIRLGSGSALHKQTRHRSCHGVCVIVCFPLRWVAMATPISPANVWEVLKRTLEHRLCMVSI